MKFSLPEGCPSKELVVPDGSVLYVWDMCVPMFRAAGAGVVKRVEDDGSLSERSWDAVSFDAEEVGKEEFADALASWCSARNPPNVYRAYLLTAADREQLLKRFPPTHPRVIADHISAESLDMMHMVREGAAKGEVIGYADHEGVQSLIVSVSGRELTSNGTPFHISWSSDPNVKTSGTGGIVRKHGFTRLEKPIPIDLSAGPTYSSPLRKIGQ